MDTDKQRNDIFSLSRNWETIGATSPKEMSPDVEGITVTLDYNLGRSDDYSALLPHHLSTPPGPPPHGGCNGGPCCDQDEGTAPNISRHYRNSAMSPAMAEEAVPVQRSAPDSVSSARSGWRKYLPW